MKMARARRRKQRPQRVFKRRRATCTRYTASQWRRGGRVCAASSFQPCSARFWWQTINRCPPNPIRYGDWFETIILLVIVANLIILSFFDPLRKHPSSFRSRAVFAGEAATTFIFAAELLLRGVALGFRRFLDPLRMLDAIVVATAVVSLFLEFSGIPNNFYGFIVLRCVRILRSVRNFSDKKSVVVLIDSIADVAYRITDATLLFLLFLILFSVAGVSQFGSRMRNRCIADVYFNDTQRDAIVHFAASSLTLQKLRSVDGSSAEYGNSSSSSSSSLEAIVAALSTSRPYSCDSLFDAEIRPLLSDVAADSENSNTNSNIKWRNMSIFRDILARSSRPELSCNTLQMCDPTDSVIFRGYTCPFGYRCAEIDNPYFSIVGFDNTLQSILTLFTSVTQQLWYEVAYMVYDATGAMAYVFMTIVIVIGGFLIVNLMIVLISVQFNEIKRIKNDTTRQQRTTSHNKRIGKIVAGLLQVRRVDEFLKRAVLNRGERRRSTSPDNNTDSVAGAKDGGSEERENGNVVNNNNNTLSTQLLVVAGDGSANDGRDAPDLERRALARRQEEEEEEEREGASRTPSDVDDVAVDDDTSVFATLSTWMGLLFENVVRKEWFEFASFLIVSFDVVVMATAYHGMSPGHKSVISTTSTIATVLYVLETLLRILAHPPPKYRYFSRVISSIDFLVVIACVADVAIKGWDFAFVHTFRFVRCAKFLRFSPNIYYWVQFIGVSLHTSPPIVALLTLLVAIFGLMCMQMLGGHFCYLESNPLLADNRYAPCAMRPRANFDSFGQALISSFQVLTGDDWNIIMYNAMRANGAYFCIFFAVFYYLGAFIMLSLLVAVMLSATDAEKAQQHVDASILHRENVTYSGSGNASFSGSASGGHDKHHHKKGQRGASGPHGRSPSPSPARQQQERKPRSNSLLAESLAGNAEMKKVGMSDDEVMSEVLAAQHRELDAARRQRSAMTGWLRIGDTGTNTATTAVTTTPTTTPVGFDSSIDHEGGTSTVTLEEGAMGPSSLPHKKNVSFSGPLAGVSATDRKSVEQQASGKRGNALQRWEQFRVNRIAHQLQYVVKHRAYGLLNVIFILLGSFSMVLNQSVYAPNTTKALAFYAIDVIVTVYYVLDVLLQMLAFGVCRGPDAYLKRTRWNAFDATLALFGVVALIISVTVRDKYIFQLLLSLQGFRPLSLVKYSPHMYFVLRALGHTASALRYVIAAIVLIFFVYAVIGVQLLSGAMLRCAPPPSAAAAGNGGVLTNFLGPSYFYFGLEINTNIPGSTSSSSSSPSPRSSLRDAFFYAQLNHTACLQEGGAWENAFATSFDNVGSAMLSLFVVTTLEMWSNMMYVAMDFRGDDLAPSTNAYKWVSVYFIFFAFISGIVLTNIFMTVMVDSYNKTKRMDEARRTQRLAREQNGWLLTERRMIRCLPKKVKKRRGSRSFSVASTATAATATRTTSRNSEEEGQEHQGGEIGDHATGLENCWHAVRRLRMLLQPIVRSERFIHASLGVIFLNFIFMASEHYPTTAAYADALNVLNSIFASLFALEAVVKIFAEGFRTYIASQWNRLDLFVAVVSIFGVAMQSVFSSRAGAMLRMLRVFRLARILKGYSKIGELLIQFAYALVALVPVAAVIFLIMFAFAIAGTRLFGRVEWTAFEFDSINRNINFATFQSCLLVLLRLGTGGNWLPLMRHVSSSSAHCTPSIGGCGPAAPVPELYFVIYLVLSMFVLRNLLIAAMLDNFLTAASIRGMPKKQANAFYASWKKYDPNFTQQIAAFDVLPMIRSIPETCVLGFNGLEDSARHKLELKVLQLLQMRSPSKRRVNLCTLIDLLCHFCYRVSAPEDRQFKHKIKDEKADELSEREDTPLASSSSSSMLSSLPSRLQRNRASTNAWTTAAASSSSATSQRQRRSEEREQQEEENDQLDRLPTEVDERVYEKSAAIVFIAAARRRLQPRKTRTIAEELQEVERRLEHENDSFSSAEGDNFFVDANNNGEELMVNDDLIDGEFDWSQQVGSPQVQQHQQLQPQGASVTARQKGNASSNNNNNGSKQQFWRHFTPPSTPPPQVLDDLDDEEMKFLNQVI